MKGIWNVHVIAESDATVVAGGNRYFPLASVDPTVLPRGVEVIPG